MESWGNVKKTIVFISIFVFLIAGFTWLYFHNEKKYLANNEQNIHSVGQTISKKDKELLKDIKEHYNSLVKTTKEIPVYMKDKKYEECGKIGKKIILQLATISKITKDDIYFKIENTEYYVSYKDVTPINEAQTNEDYKNYIPFDKSIVMDHVMLYTEGGLAYDLPENLTAPIIIDETDRKYIEYRGKLYYAKEENIREIIPNDQKGEYAKQMAVLNYHFFYNDGSKGCNESICLKSSKFEEQMKYLSDNGYYTPTMKEFEMFLDKKIRLPKKSVMLTVDDGAMGTENILPSILEKYNKRASLFLITGWNDKSKFTSPNVELHSHSDAMHKAGICPGGQGGGIKCLAREKVLEDLKRTRELLNNTTAFAYPFYEYNDYAISLLKEAGFTMAFIGGNKKAVPGVNKMLIPRYPILSDITLNSFIKKIT